MAWVSYPTYMAYLDMMTSFSDSYPDLCSLHEIGTSVNGRSLICQNSDNVSEKEAEPEFMYSSSMHGDELQLYFNLRLNWTICSQI
jgi:murein tripeptide amidase MpaA